VLKNKFVHLTNFSINKKNTNFVKNEGKSANCAEFDGGDNNIEDDLDQENSSKWSLRYLRKYLIKHYNLETCQKLFNGCRDVINKTLISAEPNIVSELNKCGNRQRCCFEIFGFDIIFD
jgi:tubulin polyglutamylase TTLL4